MGELGPGACVGEVLLLGEDVQPYQVETITRVRIGWVSAATVRGTYSVSTVFSSHYIQRP